MYKLIELVVAHKPSARNVMHYHFRWKWVLTQRHNDTTSQTQTQIHKYTNTQRNKRRKKSTHDEQEKEAKHNKEKLVSILLCVCLFFGIIPFRYVTWYFFSVCYHLSRSIFISNTSDVNKRHCEQLFKAKGFLVFHNNCEPLSSFFHALCSLFALSRSVISYVFRCECFCHGCCHFHDHRNNFPKSSNKRRNACLLNNVMYLNNFLHVTKHAWYCIGGKHRIDFFSLYFCPLATNHAEYSIVHWAW